MTNKQYNISVATAILILTTFSKLVSKLNIKVANLYYQVLKCELNGFLYKTNSKFM